MLLMTYTTNHILDVIKLRLKMKSNKQGKKYKFIARLEAVSYTHLTLPTTPYV